MKAIKRRKSGFTNEEIDGKMVQLMGKHLNSNIIHGPDFVAVELTYKDVKAQGLSVTHWKDKYNRELGFKIAYGRAMLRLTIQVLKKEKKQVKEFKEFAEIVKGEENVAEESNKKFSSEVTEAIYSSALESAKTEPLLSTR